MNWQPIETAPKDGTYVLLACNLTSKSRLPQVYVSRFYDPEDKCWDITGWCTSDGYSFANATHWSHIGQP